MESSTYRVALVVVGLAGSALMLCLLLIGLLALKQLPVPDTLQNVATVALGGLVGALPPGVAGAVARKDTPK